MSQVYSLSLMGISITFLALGLLILIIYVLGWLFQPKVEDGNLNKNDTHRHLAAAIAVAVLVKERNGKDNPNLGQLLEKQPGPWRRS